MSKKVSLLEFENNPNIGLYMFVNDKFCLLGQNVTEKKKEEIKNILNVPIFNITALGTELLGVFFAGNNEKMFIPEIFDYEMEQLDKIAKEFDVELIVINEKVNTFGNNFCVGDNHILANKDLKIPFLQDLSDISGYNISVIGNLQFKAAGGICRFIDGKYFVSQELNEDDFSDIIDKIGGVGTVNSGSNFIASGVVGNKNGLLIGSMSSTVEIQSIVEGFDGL